MKKNNNLTPKQAVVLYKRHYTGAWVRTGGLVLMSIFFSIGWISNSFTDESFKGLMFVAFLLIAINPPSLLILKKIRNRNIYAFYSFFINIIEITCYITMLYFAGGVRANYLLLVLPIAIAYVGVAAPRYTTFGVVMICILEYNLMIFLEHFRVIPHQNPHFAYDFTSVDIQLVGLGASVLLIIAGSMASSIGVALKKNRDNLLRRNRELSRISKIAKITSQSLDFDLILDSTCKELTNLFPIRYAAIGLIDDKNEKVTIVSFNAKDSQTKSLIGFELSLEGFNATKDILETKEPLFIPNADTSPKTAQLHDIFKAEGIKAMLFTPLLSRGKPIGSIGMPTLDPNFIFTESEINLVQTIANQVATAISNAQLFSKTESALDVAEHDLEIGREIQNGFLPTTMPNIEGWEIYSQFIAARQVAGDFYDAFPIDNKGNIAFVIGDVCDKGVGAALFMVVFRSLIRSFSLAQQNCEDRAKYLLNIIESVNDYIARTHNQSNMFATLFMGFLDIRTNKLHYVNAGHEIPIIVSAEGTLKARLEPTGPAVGLMPGMEFIVKNVTFDSGDILFTYTDGVVDSRNIDNEAFTEESLLNNLSRPFVSALSLVTHVEQCLNEHIKNTLQYDDIAMLAIRRSDKKNITHHEITINSEIANLPTLRQFIDHASGSMELPGDMAFAFKLSLDEVCTNIITYGYPEGEKGQISINFRKEKQQVVLTVEDEGVIFDPSISQKVDTDLDLKDLELGGMGLHVISRMVDDIQYERTEKNINRLTLTKKIHK